MVTASPSRKRNTIYKETEREAAAASSSKRARLGGADRLDDLPDCLLHDILSYLGSRQAARTSALSRRWRHLWRSVHCLNIDQREFLPPDFVPDDDWHSLLDDCQWESFEDMADTMLSSTAPLNLFRLHLIDSCRYTTVSRWVRRGLRRRPAAVDVDGNNWTIQWPPTSRLCSDACRLTKLRLLAVSLMPGFGEDLSDQCPVLEDLHIENCSGVIKTIASPTLKSLAFVDNREYRYKYAPLILAAPRLVSLRLELPYGINNAYPVANEVLASLLMASISITDKDGLRSREILNEEMKERRIRYMKYMYSFLACLTNVTSLYLSGFNTTALLDEEHQKFPVFRNLRTLALDRCDIGIDFQALPRIRNTRNLEKLKLYLCEFFDQPRKKKKRKTGSTSTSSKSRSSILRSKNLESIEIKCQESDKDHLEKLFSQISDGGQKEMWLTQWQQVKKPLNVGQTTVQLFRTQKQTESTQS